MVNGVLEQDAINIITYRYLSAAYRIWDIMLNIKLYDFISSMLFVSPRLVSLFRTLIGLEPFFMLNL
jgi:hypothetical protein